MQFTAKVELLFTNKEVLKLKLVTFVHLYAGNKLAIDQVFLGSTQ